MPCSVINPVETRSAGSKISAISNIFLTLRTLAGVKENVDDMIEIELETPASSCKQPPLAAQLSSKCVDWIRTEIFFLNPYKYIAPPSKRAKLLTNWQLRILTTTSFENYVSTKSAAPLPRFLLKSATLFVNEQYFSDIDESITPYQNSAPYIYIPFIKLHSTTVRILDFTNRKPPYVTFDSITVEASLFPFENITDSTDTVSLSIAIPFLETTQEFESTMPFFTLTFDYDDIT
jgi:hypothetical protein